MLKVAAKKSRKKEFDLIFLGHARNTCKRHYYARNDASLLGIWVASTFEFSQPRVFPRKKTMLITALGVFSDTILEYNVMTTPVFKAEIRSPRDFPFFRSIDRVGGQVSE